MRSELILILASLCMLILMKHTCHAPKPSWSMQAEHSYPDMDVIRDSLKVCECFGMDMPQHQICVHACNSLNYKYGIYCKFKALK